MPIGHQNLEWLNHNSQRRYPLADDADGTDTTGSFSLPTDFIVELDLPVNAGMDVSSARFFVRSVAAYGGGYGLTVGYQPAAGDPVNVATALIPRQGFTRYATFVLGGVGDFADTVGKVVIGRLENIDDQPPGMWDFTLETARLDPDAVRPILAGVTSLTCVNADQRSVPLYGDVFLEGGTNVQLTTVIQSGQDPIIRINVIEGEGTVQPCVCEGEAAPTDPITSILGIAPTAAGNFNILGSDCVEVVPVANGIRLVDRCAQPCCGPTELEVITNTLERLMSQAASVEAYVGQLATSVNTMDLVVLGSQLNDAGCGIQDG